MPYNNSQATDVNNDYDNNAKYETHYYVGEHVEGCDRDGPINVYHYISESALNGRGLNTIDAWDYDLELWPGDRYWLEASGKKTIVVESMN